MYGEDVYSNPEKYGLEIVGSVEWEDEPYQFNMTAVWRDRETGQLYWADDSGCSCPSPFEEFTSRDSLTAGTAAELDARLSAALAGTASRSAAEVADLMLKVKTYSPAATGDRQS
jgi:hypothetical protein